MNNKGKAPWRANPELFSPHIFLSFYMITMSLKTFSSCCWVTESPICPKNVVLMSKKRFWHARLDCTRSPRLLYLSPFTNSLTSSMSHAVLQMTKRERHKWIFFFTIPISFNIVKETPWLLSLYTNLSIIKAVKLFRWLGTLHTLADLPFISCQAWKTWTWIRGLICSYYRKLVPESRPCLSKPDRLIRGWEIGAGVPGGGVSTSLELKTGWVWKAEAPSLPLQLIWLPFLPQGNDAQ